MSNLPKSQITFTVEAAVYTGLSRLAKAANVATGRMALMLFEAAYSARHKPTGDADLDAAVARMCAPVATSEGDEVLRAKITELSAKLVENTEWDQRLVKAEATNAENKAKISRLETQISNQVKLIIDGKAREAAMAISLADAANAVPSPPPSSTPPAGTSESDVALAAAVAELAKSNADIKSLEQSIDARDEQHQRMGEVIEALNAEVTALKNRAAPDTTDLIMSIVIAFGTGQDTKQVADRVHLSEATVSRILTAWRNETEKQRAVV